MIKSRQLAKAIFELEKDGVKDLDSKFFEFIEKSKLKAQLPQIIHHLEKIAKREDEKKSIQIEVAHEIKEDTISRIKKHLNAEHLPEIVKIKKEIIGGFRAKWGGVVYDSSIETGLKKLEEIITK